MLRNETAGKVLLALCLLNILETRQMYFIFIIIILLDAETKQVEKNIALVKYATSAFMLDPGNSSRKVS